MLIALFFVTSRNVSWCVAFATKDGEVPLPPSARKALDTRAVEAKEVEVKDGDIVYPAGTERPGSPTPSTQQLSKTLNAIPPPVAPLGGKPRKTRAVGSATPHEPEETNEPLSVAARIVRAAGLYLVVLISAVWLLYRQFRRTVKTRKAAPKF